MKLFLIILNFKSPYHTKIKKKIYDVSKRLKIYRDEINLNSFDYIIKFFSSNYLKDKSKKLGINVIL
jgi:hypothetical protein